MANVKRGTAPALVVAGLVAVAVIVWGLAVAWLPVLLITAAAAVLVALARHGDRLAVAYWPSRRRAEDGAAPAVTAARPETGAPDIQPRDEWLS